MNHSCEHCAHIIVDNGAGEWLHADSMDVYCASNQTTDMSNRKVATYKPAKPVPQPDRLGCPRCGSEHLTMAQVVFEPIEFWTDGNCEFPEGITDYGDTLAIMCDQCDWRMGDLPVSQRVNPNDFIEVHKEAIRAEIMKEMNS